jgi:hypothetical protein
MNLRATFMPMSALPGLNAVPGGETRGALLRALILRVGWDKNTADESSMGLERTRVASAA